MNIKEMAKQTFSLQLTQKQVKGDVQVTDHRTKKDFARYMKHLIENVFPDAKKIRCIMDNLNTHTKKSFS